MQPGLSAEPHHLALPAGHIDLTSWRVKEGVERYEDFTYYTYEAYQQGRQPTVTSFYGHLVPSQFLEVSYIGRGNQHLRCMVTFKSRTFNYRTQMVEERYAYTLPAWQGTNDTIHLLEVAPGETYRKFNLHALLEAARAQPYEDVVERICRRYTAQELIHLAPEVLFFEDPVLKVAQVPVQLPYRGGGNVQMEAVKHRQ
jgi:hypothetical protein